jgi:U2-associated protein SR140
VFDHLASIYHSFPGRITAETFKTQITSILDIWEDWIVFPSDFAAELRSRLEGQTIADAGEEDAAVKDVAEEHGSTSLALSRFKAISSKPADTAALEEHKVEEDGEPMDEGSDMDQPPTKADTFSLHADDVDGVAIEVGVDGEPMDDDVDGEPMGDDVDGEPIEDDVDGMPIADDLDGDPMEDVDGEPLDDVDGVPVEEGD